MVEPTGSGGNDVRVRAFVDFWNFQIAMNKWRDHFPLDWNRLGPWLAEQAGTLFLASGQQGRIQYEGLHVYMSYNPLDQKDHGLRNWATNVLDRFPGVEVVMKQRRPKDPPECPTCHTPVTVCPETACGMRFEHEADDRKGDRYRDRDGHDPSRLGRLLGPRRAGFGGRRCRPCSRVSQPEGAEGCSWRLPAHGHGVGQEVLGLLRRHEERS